MTCTCIYSPIINFNNMVCYIAMIGLVPRPIPSFSMLHAEKWEGLVCEIRPEKFETEVHVGSEQTRGSN